MTKEKENQIKSLAGLLYDAQKLQRDILLKSQSETDVSLSRELFCEGHVAKARVQILHNELEELELNL